MKKIQVYYFYFFKKQKNIYIDLYIFIVGVL